MPRIFIHVSLLFFLITASSGVWMRLFPFTPTNLISYTNVLHGHSHLAILGWAFLGVFLIFLFINWDKITNQKQAIYILITLSIVSFGMFVAFVYQGYGVFSIAISTIHIFVEYWAALFILRHISARTDIPKSGALFMKGALIALVISSIGPFALGIISANGLKEHAVFDMAIYFYLHFQYNGWLYLFLIGLLVTIIHYKNIVFQDGLAKASFWIYFLALFPGYFSSILWVDLGSYSELFAIIGAIGQWIGVIGILFLFKQVWKNLSQFYHKLALSSLWISFALLLIKSTMELGLIFPQLAELIYDTRSIIIGYLHLTLLGFVSTFILALFFMEKMIRITKITMIGFIMFMIGFFLNELVLFIQGLLEWLQLPVFSYNAHGLLAASILLWIGILFIWLSYFSR